MVFWVQVAFVQKMTFALLLTWQYASRPHGQIWASRLMLAIGTITPECCTHCGAGLSVSLTGGNGENILTSLDAGGKGEGAISEARSIGGSAGSDELEVEGAFDGSGACGGVVCLVRPGGGEKVPPVVLVKRVRLGLMGMGVPSSSSGVGGGVVEWAAVPGSLSVCGEASVTLALLALELDERV